MSITFPSSGKTAGQAGFIPDVNNLYDAVTATSGLNVLNDAYAGGADPTGVGDSTAAVQAALNAAAGSGGMLRWPGGDYKLTGTVQYTGTAPLRILGDGPQATRIRCASTATNEVYLAISQTGSWGDQLGGDGTTVIDGLSFYNDHFVGSFSNQCVGLLMDGVNLGLVINCGFYKGTGSQRLNQGIVLNACNQVLIDNCNIFSVVNGVAFTGFGQVCTLSKTSVWQPSGSGVGTAASVLVQGRTLGVQMADCVMHDGDRGLLMTADAGGQVPHFVVLRNFQPNNHTIAGMECDFGAQITLDQCVFSGNTVTSIPVPGIVFGANWQGSSAINHCVFNGMSGHSIALNNGSGFTIANCEIGGQGTYKSLGGAGTFDEINVGPVSNVVIAGNRFNVTALAGLGTSNPPRSAVHVDSGASNVVLSSSIAAPSGYLSTALAGSTGIPVKTGCINL